MTRFAAPILLPRESPSPSNVLKFKPVKLIGCVSVCEFPKTIRRFGGTESARGLRKSLSSAAADIARRPARIPTEKTRRDRITFSSLGDREQLGVNADFGIDRLARFDLRGSRARSQRVDVFDHLVAAIALTLGLKLFAREDRVPEQDRGSDRDDHVGSGAARVIARDAARH